MKILVWTPPWIAHGDPLFYRNTLRKHLARQASLLASVGHDVLLVVPELLLGALPVLHDRVRVEVLTLDDHVQMTGGLSDPSVELYAEPEGGTAHRIATTLAGRLPGHFDVILLWETPVPFFEELYPTALIVHQMPGAFSRPPYPHTVTFDPVGLYRQGTLHKMAGTILEAGSRPISTLHERFSALCSSTIRELRPFSRFDLDPRKEFEHLTLLPLQVSSHYAFQVDTPFRTQAEFLIGVLGSSAPTTGVVVTQYVTPRVHDSVLSPEVHEALRLRFPNLIHLPEFNQYSSISQYLLGEVDSITTCSSSLAFQGLLWGLPIQVIGSTFLENYDYTASGPHVDSMGDCVLPVLLERLNPLARAVTEDAEFLNHILEDLVARRQTQPWGLERLARFEEISSAYADQLIEGFTQGRARREVTKVGPRLEAASKELSAFEKILTSTRPAAITFDVFDTLLTRPFEVPADAWHFLESRALELTDGKVENFARYRVAAETQARENSSRGEVTLAEIYSVLKTYYGLDDPTCQILQDAEIEFEKNAIRARPVGLELFERAKRTGVPIYLVSDMYLPLDVILSMLDRVKVHGFRQLFLSSVWGVRKKEGALYDVVLNELGLRGEQILHVGDNKIADVEQAEKRGIRAFRVARAVDRLRGNATYAKLFDPKRGVGERARSALVGTLAYGLFDRALPKEPSHAYGSPYFLGFATLGPLVTGFALWLEREARANGSSRLFFLAREGQLLQRAYDILRTPEAPPSTYLLTSRRAIRVPSLLSEADVLALAAHPYEQGAMLKDLLESRFGIDAGTLRLGESGEVERVDATPEGRVAFSRTCARFVEQILGQAAVERRAMSRYLESVGFFEETSAGVVDVGWRANIQGALGKVTSRSLTGYYIATLQGAERWAEEGHRLCGYLGTSLTDGHPSSIVRNRAMLEYLLCGPTQSLIRMSEVSSGIFPQFRDDNSPGRQALITELHRGALGFVKTFSSAFPDADRDIWIDPFLAERVLGDFLQNPAPIDARLFDGHVFEDALAGVGRRPLVGSNLDGQSRNLGWAPGHEVLSRAPRAKTAEGTRGSARIERSGEASGLPKVVTDAERYLVHRLTSDRKAQKYDRDRASYFQDSHSTLAKAWLRLTDRDRRSK